MDVIPSRIKDQQTITVIIIIIGFASSEFITILFLIQVFEGRNPHRVVRGESLWRSG